MKLSRRAAASCAALAIVGTALAGCSKSSETASDTTPSLTIMVGGIDKVIYLPAMLTERLGYFKDAGVNVKLMTEPSGASAENELVAHQVQGVVGFYDHTVTMQAKGKCIESVVQLAKVPGEVEIVSTKASADIASTKDLRGKKLGVTSPGSSTDYLTQYLAAKAGIASKDYTTVTAGAGSTFLAALQNGGIDAGMTTDPTAAQVLDKGLGKVLIDMRTVEGTQAALGGLYPASSLYMDCDYVAKNKDTVQKVVDAFVKTLAWVDSHSASDIAAKMPADYAGDNPDLYVKAIDSSKSMFTSDGIMPATGPQTVLDVLGTFNPDVKAKKGDLKLSETFTTNFAKAAGK